MAFTGLFFRMFFRFSALQVFSVCCRVSVAGRYVSGNGMGWCVGRVCRAWLGLAVCLLFAGAVWAGDYEDGMQCYHDGAYDKAFAAFSRAAGQGDAAAQSALALIRVRPMRSSRWASCTSRARGSARM